LISNADNTFDYYIWTQEFIIVINLTNRYLGEQP